MARPWSRKGEDRGSDAAKNPRGDVHLDAAEHAWWAQRDATELLSQTSHPERGREPEGEAEDESEPKRDILAEHFGADWRTSFGFDGSDDVPLYQPPSDQQLSDEPPPDEPPPDEEPAEEESAEELAEDVPEIDTSDPYAVLEVDPGASWEEIVDAHRRQARLYHPDRLGGQPEAVIAAAEDRIRYINVAYQELRVRRGK